MSAIFKLQPRIFLLVNACLILFFLFHIKFNGHTHNEQKHNHTENDSPRMVTNQSVAAFVNLSRILINNSVNVEVPEINAEDFEALFIEYLRSEEVGLREKHVHLHSITLRTILCLELLGIEYSLYGGSLLGSMRSQAIIPWDDDVDILILKRDEPKLRSKEFVAELNRHNLSLFLEKNITYKTRQHDFLLNNVTEITTKTVRTFASFTNVDIFVYEDKGRGMYDYSFGLASWRNRFIRESEYRPRKLYRFGPYSVFGLQNPLPYFKTFMGSDPLKTFTLSHSHAPEINSFVQKYRINVPLNITNRGLIDFKFGDIELEELLNDEQIILYRELRGM